jgi:hypothetical protein
VQPKGSPAIQSKSTAQIQAIRDNEQRGQIGGQLSYVNVAYLRQLQPVAAVIDWVIKPLF